MRPIVFVEAKNVGPKQRPTTILVKPSFTTGDPGAANGIAQAWHKKYSRLDSCHYVVDEKQTIQCVPVRKASFPYGAGAFTNAITINMCYDPPSRPSNLVMFHTANLVAHLCKEHRIKLRFLDDEQILRWGEHKWKSRGGIDVLDCWPLGYTDFDVLTKAAFKDL